jgi:hypothetical protein
VGTVALDAGWHPITVGMFQATGGLELSVTWNGPGMFTQPPTEAVLGRAK